MYVSLKIQPPSGTLRAWVKNTKARHDTIATGLLFGIVIHQRQPS
jgi:hypothetical protein